MNYHKYRNSHKNEYNKDLNQLIDQSINQYSALTVTTHPLLHVSNDGHNIAKFNRTSCIPEAPAPYTLAGRSSLSALPNLAAETIFIDLVIFWIFFTLLSRKETKKQKYILSNFSQHDCAVPENIHTPP